MTTYDLFGPVDGVLGAELIDKIVVVQETFVIEKVYLIELLLLGLLVANMGARHLAHRRHLNQATDGDDALSRHPLHVATNVLLVVGAFYYLTFQPHAGMVTSVLVLGMLITDIFEFESRKVEVRREIDVERPKAAIAASVLALVYLAYVTFLYGPIGEML